MPANSQIGPGDPAGAPGPVRAAIAGPGHIARVHANALRSLGGQAESVAAGVDDSALKAFRDEHRIPPGSGDAGDLPRRGAAEFVRVCTPPKFNRPRR